MVMETESIGGEAVQLERLNRTVDNLNEQAEALLQAQARAQLDELTRAVERLARQAIAPKQFEELRGQVEAQGRA
ncbi:MAG TPA: hypothetical protein VF310_01045, partial [Vicinamibacteria bacterium]